MEQLELETELVRLVATVEDGEALFAAVCQRGLEGVVAEERERAGSELPLLAGRALGGVGEVPDDAGGAAGLNCSAYCPAPRSRVDMS